MSHYKPYPAYKDSGVEWLEKVPEHWGLAPFKYGLRLLTEKTDERSNMVSLENIEGWTGRHIATESEYEGEGIAFQAGDILFGKLRPYLAKVLRAGKAGQAIGDFYVLRPAFQFYPKFTQYWLLNSQVIDQLNGTTLGAKMPRVNWDDMGALPLPCPSGYEQATIVAHLDRETSRIDALVEKKTRFIELLREKRQALITHAVTKGLDPHVKMKDSGVEWLGEVPEHWEVKPLKYVTSHIGSGKTPTGGASAYQNSGVIFLRSQNVYEDGLRLEDVAFISDEIDEEMRGSRVQENDVLLNITGASIGRSCHVSRNIGAANVNQHVCIIRALVSEYGSWIARLMASHAAQTQIDYFQNGAGREGLNFEQIGNMIFAFPSPVDAKKVIEKLQQRVHILDALTSKTERSIELLKERRSALITAAVTGQIDLREPV
jgi:type I restriction enzyme, S subunit